MVSIAAPWILLGLLAIPLLVWLLRAMPPRPVRQVFGGMFFLRKLDSPKQEPVRTPPLLLLIRIVAFSALLLGLAGLRWNDLGERTDADVLLVVSNGWDAAQHWEETLKAARQVINQTEGTIRLLTTSDGELSIPYSPRAAEQALRRIGVEPVLTDWDSVLTAIPDDAARAVLLVGGVSADGAKLPAGLGPMSAYVPEANVVALGSPRITNDALTVRLFRTKTKAAGTYQVRAVSRDGRTISTEEVVLAPGEADAEAVFRLPLALRNDVARLSIEGVRSAGAVVLLGSSARRALAGIVSSGTDSLREGGFYITRALAASADVREGSLAALLALDPGLMILDDVGTLRAEDQRQLEAYVRSGGVVLRFAGPNLLAAGSNRDDPLLPAPLLGSERALGGALTWAKPQTVADIETGSPLSGLRLTEEICVRKQVLTEPGAGAEVWVSLADETPLITAARRDQGLVILVHVSAIPTWSDLPATGLFAGIMQRIAALAETNLDRDTDQSAERLLPQRLLDGRGRLIEPPALAAPWIEGEAAPRPGLYGEGPLEVASQAFQGDELTPMTPELLPRGTRLLTLDDQTRRDFSGPLIAVALLLMILDAIISMGRFAPSRIAATAAVIAAIVTPIPSADAQLRPPLSAQSKSAALALRFAYVKTGDPRLDELSAAGLYGLTAEATRRSALEPARPQGVDLDRDELSVYALLYWPVRPRQTPPSDAALQRLEQFMTSGGMLIIDTADGSAPGRSPVLREVLGRLDAPPLEPLPDDHVLLFSFYALDDLPGRNSGDQVWVETRGALDQRRDGVPSLIVSGRDWAGAWALDEGGVPLRPAGPGGEVRREYAFRAGINMAMVAITGNYKADQADVQTLLDQLGVEAE